MATSIIMPKAGMAMETGTIIEWNVSVGDKIEVGDEILEIETDKVAMPVEAETSGYLLATLAQPGDVVPVTETIGWIGEQGENVPEAEEPAAAATAEPEASGQDNVGESGSETAERPSDARPERIGERVKATPAARRRAAELGIDLSQLSASGPDNDVRLRDVERAASDGAGTTDSSVSPLARKIADQAGLSLEGLHGSGPGGRIQKRDVVEQATATAQSSASSRGAGDAHGFEARTTRAPELAGDTRAPLVGLRKVVAERMSESHQDIPPVTLNSVAHVDALMELRRSINEGSENSGRPRFSLNDFLLAAAAKAVRSCPWVNIAFDGENVIEHEAVNIGMAVAIQQGLIVPVIRDADRLTLTEISELAKDLQRRARDRKLGVSDLENGTFTVTNLGMYGITTFTPIINPPQAAILGVGTIRNELALAEDKSVKEHAVIDLSLTVDHRLIDGAQGALFLKEFVSLLQSPARILV